MMKTQRSHLMNTFYASVDLFAPVGRERAGPRAPIGFKGRVAMIERDLHSRYESKVLL